MDARQVGVLGASSLVGDHVLRELTSNGTSVIAFSRQRHAPINGVHWRYLSDHENDSAQIAEWICLAPIWVLPDYFDAMESAGVHKIVALSSTSRFSKAASASAAERALAARLAEAEQRIQDWAERGGVQWFILRPTLIYGNGRDRNVSDIARFLRRWRCFPLVGGGNGLRQPVHAVDVAAFCVKAMQNPHATGRVLDICGGETLSYREMVLRIGAALGVPVRFIVLPRLLLRCGVWLFSALPRFRSLTPAMVDRMTQDLVVDGSAANRLLGVEPRRFAMTTGDLPLS